MKNTNNRANVFVCGGFDDIRAHHIRFLEEASKLGQVTVLLWTDERIHLQTGYSPKFSAAERLYFVQSIRFVNHVQLVKSSLDMENLLLTGCSHADYWVERSDYDTPAKRAFCEANKVNYIVLKDKDLSGFNKVLKSCDQQPSRKKKVMVTGCFDWLHSGHVRFFEETSNLGDLYVVLGHDANVLLLKGNGHPLFPQEERCYMVQSIRFVKQALISSGNGWMDAEPEIAQIKPDIYAVNEDGDKLEKRDFCAAHGIEYVALKRLPKAGLPRRESTALRGF